MDKLEQIEKSIVKIHDILIKLQENSMKSQIEENEVLPLQAKAYLTVAFAINSLFYGIFTNKKYS